MKTETVNTIKTKKTNPFTIISIVILLITALGVATYFAIISLSAKTPEQGKDTPIIVEPAPKKIKYELDTSILFLGDIMTARTIGERILNGEDPFMYVEAEFKKHDTIIGNIETNISASNIGQPIANKLYTFNAPVESIATIKNAGIDVAVVANNHTSDYGPDAVNDMKKKLEVAGLKTVGAGANIEEAFKPAIVEIPLIPYYEDGSSLTDTEAAKLADMPTVKVAIIALNDIETWATNVTAEKAGSAYFDKDLFVSEVKKARNEMNADFVVVIPHWGFEYQATQDPSQTEWAHFFIDSGADLVVGGHPHVIQPSEAYAGKMIYYSLGNFIFDEMPQVSEAATLGEMLSVKIKASRPVDSDEVTVQLGEQTLIKTKLDEKGFPGIIN
jgi:poly-gamma-glutamate capsule biosynthesis protein CapA/YwtB (metallophosphatase superfamily)